MIGSCCGSWLPIVDGSPFAFCASPSATCPYNVLQATLVTRLENVRNLRKVSTASSRPHTLLSLVLWPLVLWPLCFGAWSLGLGSFSFVFVPFGFLCIPLSFAFFRSICRLSSSICRSSCTMPMGSMPMRPWFEKPLVDSTIGFGTLGAIRVVDQVPFGNVWVHLRIRIALRRFCVRNAPLGPVGSLSLTHDAVASRQWS